MKPSRSLDKASLKQIDDAIGLITEYYAGHKESIPYRFNPNDPRHAKMYYRGCENNAYIPILIFIYRYGSDETDWGPVMVYLNPRTSDVIWLHGFVRVRPDPQSSRQDEYVYSLWEGIHVSDPGFNGFVGHIDNARVDFLSLVSQIGNKEKLESVVTSLILGRLAQAETWLNIDSANAFRKKLLDGPRMPFYATSIDMISYPATIFMKKFIMLLIRCAKENEGQLITHRFRVASWLRNIEEEK